MPASPRQAEALLQRVEWTVVRRLDGALQGNYRTLFRGAGLDFADLREYQAHDDVRHIDWNVTARTQVPHVRIFHEDREVTAWFLLDLSPSVDFGSGDTNKRQVLTEFTAALARIFVHHGNKVGAILFDGVDELIVPARGGRRHLLHLIDKLLSHPRRLRAPQTDLGGFFHRAGSALKRRSIVFAVSDFVSLPGWQTSLGALARRHEAVAVRLVDPLEQALPDLGLLAIEDAETGEQLLVDTGDRTFRDRFSALAGQWEEEIVDGFNQAGIDALELSTADDLANAILRFVTMRRISASGAIAGATA
ncbi:MULTISPECIES: DUF58 domain-containing protein [unclassified Devosia]|uniref:DUF58 domain-containing protein n=1 Tax=unclassified Devosia TaxID=196773 RepID=UPI001AEE1BB4|nr:MULTISPECIES: DUF58 domain-containing protein [unclassified Devosia]